MTAPTSLPLRHCTYRACGGRLLRLSDVDGGFEWICGLCSRVGTPTPEELASAETARQAVLQQLRDTAPVWSGRGRRPRGYALRAGAK